MKDDARQNALHTHGRPFYSEEADAFYKYVVSPEDGSTVLTKRRGRIFPLPEQKLFAENLVQQLNWQIHHDGAWVVYWAEPKMGGTYDKFSGIYKPGVPQALFAVWCDDDGDPKVSVEIRENIWKMYDAGLTNWLEPCENAWQEAMAMLGELQVRPDQQYRRNLGEQSISDIPTAPILGWVE